MEDIENITLSPVTQNPEWACFAVSSSPVQASCPPRRFYSKQSKQTDNDSSTTVNKNLDGRALLVFHRLVNFYNTLNVISALVAGLSLAVISFGEFHPETPPLTPLIAAASGLLTSSSLTAVISVMVSTMLMFKFEGQEAATRKELMLAWSPLVMLDLAIVEFLLGVTLWYADADQGWRVGLVAGQLVVLLLFASWVAVWMWNSMSVKGGLGSQEAELMKLTRGADG